MECKLQELPRFLDIKTLDKKTLRYRLSGVIGYNACHYIAYGRRISGEWRFFNDCVKLSRSIGGHTKILPHGLLYLLNH